LGKIVKNVGHLSKKKVFSLATLAKMLEKMGYPSKRYKISPTASFSVLVSIVPSKYDFFFTISDYFGPQNVYFS